MSAINNFSGLFRYFCYGMYDLDLWVCGGGVGVLFTLERVISTWIC